MIVKRRGILSSNDVEPLMIGDVSPDRLAHILRSNYVSVVYHKTPIYVRGERKYIENIAEAIQKAYGQVKIGIRVKDNRGLWITVERIDN